MEWLQRMNEALNVLEEQLQGEIDLGRVARVAACSTFHFQRMFGYIAGVALGEYIRRRRMVLTMRGRGAVGEPDGAAGVGDGGTTVAGGSFCTGNPDTGRNSPALTGIADAPAGGACRSGA